MPGNSQRKGAVRPLMRQFLGNGRKMGCSALKLAGAAQFHQRAKHSALVVAVDSTFDNGTRMGDLDAVQVEAGGGVQQVFGQRGLHARSAVGVAVLPLDSPVEVELIVEANAASF